MLIRDLPVKVVERESTYAVRVCGDERVDGTWSAWIEFHPKANGEAILRTDQETSQPNLNAVEYWADGLEPVYIQGALARARGRLL